MLPWTSASLTLQFWSKTLKSNSPYHAEPPTSYSIAKLVDSVLQAMIWLSSSQFLLMLLILRIELRKPHTTGSLFKICKIGWLLSASKDLGDSSQFCNKSFHHAINQSVCQEHLTWIAKRQQVLASWAMFYAKFTQLNYLVIKRKPSNVIRKFKRGLILSQPLFRLGSFWLLAVEPVQGKIPHM